MTPPGRAIGDAPPAAVEPRTGPAGGDARAQPRLASAPSTPTQDPSAGAPAGRASVSARSSDETRAADADRSPAPAGPLPSRADGIPGDPDRGACTAPQLRRFIKSRAYVPMHELRRRFAINGGEDDVTPVDLAAGTRVFVGLPNREGRLLGELLRAGDIGYELSLDPISPIVVGVFPMRPVPRA